MNPPRGLTAIGSALLGFEGIVVLLALGVEHGLHAHVGVVVVVTFLVLAAALWLGAGLLRRRGGTALGSVLQVAVVAGGVVVPVLYGLGVVFAGLWLGYLRLRRSVP